VVRPVVTSTTVALTTSTSEQVEATVVAADVTASGKFSATR
jgi:hypothetical protein